MKKNDFATFFVYIGMIAIAVLVGFFVIRPTIEQTNAGTSGIVFTVLFVVLGIVLNSLLIELGHFLGAKTGHYDVVGWVCLGIGWKKKADGKWKFGFSGFDGLTGETKMVPQDIKNSSISGLVFFPILFYLVEIIAGIIIIAISDGLASDNASFAFLKLFMVCAMATGGMVYLYDYFPAHLDSVTDGYRMIAFNKPVNREAYNRMLLNQYNLEMGRPVSDKHVYQDITDLTASVNMTQVYNCLDKNDINGALNILQLTIDTENKISSITRNTASVMKLSLILSTSKKDVGAKYYEQIENDLRSYISELNDGPSLRSYLLVTGILEGTETETNYALSKALRILSKEEDMAKPAETKLLKLTIQRIATLHPNWELVLDSDLKEKDEKGEKSKNKEK